MTSFPIRGAIAAATIALTGLGAVAFAQTSPAPAAGPHGAHARPDPAQMAARHAQHLRDALQLTSAQEPALAAFMASMKPPEGMRDGMRARMGERGQPLSTPERLDRQRARMAERTQRFDQHAAAIKRFYAQLTPAQQKAFDALHMSGGRHGPRGGHGGMRGGMGGMGGKGGGMGGMGCMGGHGGHPG